MNWVVAKTTYPEAKISCFQAKITHPVAKMDCFQAKTVHPVAKTLLIIETIVKMNLENNLSEDRVVFYYYFFKNPNINKYIAISCLGVEDIFIKEEYIKTLEFLE